MDKTILRRLELLQLKHEEPVRLWVLYQLPDGSEVRMRWKDNDQQLRQWEADTGARSKDLIIEVKEGDHY